MLQSPEMQAKIQRWRAQAAEGKMTQEDWKQVFEDLRASRSAAQAASAASKTKKAAKAPRDTATLLGGLKALAEK